MSHKERKQWFIDRIGKTIYGSQAYCHCTPCKEMYENGLTIEDKLQATIAFDAENTFIQKNKPIRYFDTIEERNAYEKFASQDVLEIR